MAAKTSKPSSSAGSGTTADPNVTGLYFALHDRMSVLEPMLQDFYIQLITELGLVDYQILSIDFKKEEILSKELLQQVISRPDSSGEVEHRVKRQNEKPQNVVTKDELLLFRGGYIQLFRDGSLLQKIMYRIFECLGEAKITWMRWKGEFTLKGKELVKLRTFYRFVNDSFVAQMKLEPYCSFAVDTILYSEWDVSHPNLVGFHMLMLTWMLNVKEFSRFIPSYMKSSKPFVEPLLKLYFPLSGISMKLTDPQATNQPTESAPSPSAERRQTL